MITYVVGDLFTSPAKVLVNTVNTVGVMGKGIAHEFKRIYPEMFEQYQYYCEHGMFDVGKLWLYKTTHKWILNFPTKKHWRNKSKVEWIETGLKKFADTYDSKGITSVSFPMLGCGNGELDWITEVQPLMEKYLKPLPIDSYIHVFPVHMKSLPEHRNVQSMHTWLRDDPRSLPFSEFWDDLLALIRRNVNFETVADKMPYSVRFDDVRENFHFNSGMLDLSIGHEALRDFWQLVRSSGYCIATEFPAGLNQHADYLIPVLSAMPYIETVNLSRRPCVSSTDFGIQLIPDSSVFISPSHDFHELKTA